MDEKQTKAMEFLKEAMLASFGPKFDEIKTAFDEGQEAIKRLEAENKEFKQFKEQVENTPAEKVQLPVPGSNKKVAAYKGYELSYQGKDLNIGTKYVVTPEQKETVSKFLIDSITKATNIGSNDARGGFLVPPEWESMVLAHAREYGIALKDCTVLTMGSDTLNVPRENALVAVTWKGEEAAFDASNPTFTNAELVARKLGAYTIVSNELLMDNKYDFVSLLTSQFGEKISTTLDSAVFNAGNSSTFTGCLSGATTNVLNCAASATSPSRYVQLTHDEMSQAIAKLTSAKLRGAKWYTHRNAIHHLRTEEDTGGSLIWSPPTALTQGTFSGYPYEIVDAFTATPGANTPKVLFGNLKAGYLLGVRAGVMQLEVNPYSGWTTYQTYFRVVNRFAGTMGLESALVVIKSKA
jgi:HK97 family phage major capsid protein